MSSHLCATTDTDQPCSSMSWSLSSPWAHYLHTPSVAMPFHFFLGVKSSLVFWMTYQLCSSMLFCSSWVRGWLGELWSHFVLSATGYSTWIIFLWICSGWQTGKITGNVLSLGDLVRKSLQSGICCSQSMVGSPHSLFPQLENWVVAWKAYTLET